MKKSILLFLFIYNIVYGCTIFNTKSSKNLSLVGRSFDWSGESGRINFIPSTSHNNAVILLSQSDVNMPYEGMNDKGLFVGISAVPNTSTPLNLFKPIRKSLEMVKIVLQQASTIDEVIDLFSKQTIVFGHFLGNPLVHFKIVDKNANTVVIEFVNNKIEIIKDNKIMTNHYLSNNALGSDSKSSFERFNIVANSIKKKSHTIDEVFEILEKVSQEDTLWSTVYDLTNQRVYIKFKNSNRESFNLKDELYIHNGAYFYDINNTDKPIRIENDNPLFTLRPHFGFGTDDNSYYGGRVLLNAGSIRKYGLEFSKFKIDSDEFTGVGIVLEQRLWDWFNMSIGTIGYLNYGEENQNIFGLTQNLGWEPNNHIPFKPFVTYRNDTIFAQESTDIFHSISIGFGFEF